MILADLEKQYTLETYKKYPIEITRGAGSWVWDSAGKKYLDFYGGHAVCLLGHCPPAVVHAIKEQASRLMFYSNVVSVKPTVELAAKLARTLAPEEYKAYFANSGAEANETALKIARKHTGKKQIISFRGSFHGRMTAALSVTGIDSYHKYDPNLDPYSSFAELGDIKTVESAYTEDTAAVICESIQSIGGMEMAAKSFYQELEKFCREKKMLLIFDEVQTGLGRTGTFWFSEYLGVKPDIITCAKGIASGLPLSVVLVSAAVAAKIAVGDHATTFGGGPVVCAAGLATIEAILAPGFLAEVKDKSRYLRTRMESLPPVRGTKGAGLLVGVELEKELAGVLPFIKNGLILGTSSNKKVLRMMPPLTVSRGEIDEAVDIFARTISIDYTD